MDPLKRDRHILRWLTLLLMGFLVALKIMEEGLWAGARLILIAVTVTVVLDTLLGIYVRIDRWRRARARKREEAREYRRRFDPPVP